MYCGTNNWEKIFTRICMHTKDKIKWNEPILCNNAVYVKYANFVEIHSERILCLTLR